MIHTQELEPTNYCLISSPGFQASRYRSFETLLLTSIYAVMPLNMIAKQSNMLL